LQAHAKSSNASLRSVAEPDQSETGCDGRRPGL